MKYWFGFYVYFCPVALVISILIGCKAKNNSVLSTYAIETWNREYYVYSGSERVINNSMLLLDITNLLWSIIGTILNFSLSKSGVMTLTECQGDYGIFTICLVFVMYMMGYV